MKETEATRSRAIKRRTLEAEEELSRVRAELEK